MWLRLAFLCLLLSWVPVAAAADASASYQALVAAAKRGDGTVDWQKLRFAYSESPDFDLFGVKTQALREKMSAAFRAGDFAGAVAQAKLVLDQVYVDIDAHVVCDLGYRKLGDATRAKQHHDIVL